MLLARTPAGDWSLHQLVWGFFKRGEIFMIFQLTPRLVFMLTWLFGRCLFCVPVLNTSAHDLLVQKRECSFVIIGWLFTIILQQERRVIFQSLPIKMLQIYQEFVLEIWASIQICLWGPKIPAKYLESALPKNREVHSWDRSHSKPIKNRFTKIKISPRHIKSIESSL